MALTNDQITAQNFADFYQMILPYLNGGQSAENVTYGQGSVKDALDELANAFITPDYAHVVAVTPNTTYNTPSDGYFIAARMFGSTPGTWININGASVMDCNPNGGRDMGSCIYPVKKGDSIVTSNLDASVARLYFAPCRR